MAEFKLGRIRFVWKGVWATGTTYYKDDVVRFGGKVYLCQIGHIASEDFNTDLDINPTKWNLMSDGQRWRDDWTVDTRYEEGDLVKYGGTVYVCINGHTSATTAALGLEINSSDWNTFVDGIEWKNDWTPSTRYKFNDLVRYGGINYICITGHTSAATAALGLEANSGNWQVFTQGQEYRGTWTTTTRYKVNDIVKWGAGLWICVTQHTSSSFPTDSANWAQYVEGFEFENNWNSSTAYQPGDVVRYGGNNYVAKTLHTNSNPLTGTANWDLFSEGLKYQNNWSNTTSYKIGEIVKLNGYNYLAIADSPSNTYTVTASNASTDRFTTSNTAGMVAGMTVRFTGTTFGGVFTSGRYYVKQVISSTEFTISTISGGSTFDATAGSGSMTATVSAEPPNSSYWSAISHGIFWRGVWTDDTEYNIGDTVRYGTNAYICILTHRSEGDDGSTLGTQGGGQANSRPDLDVTGTYWNVFVVGDETSVLTTVGDMVYYGGSGPTRLPVGTEGQVLRVSSAGIPEWVSWGSTPYVYYVSPEGEDRPYPDCGATLDKPWKTIRYACEQIENGPRNPQAAHLLELNRVFIQREVTAWIRDQIANAPVGGIWENFDYDEYKCERDVGFIVDRVIWDITHGGNLKTLAAALSYINALDGGSIFATAEDENGTGTYTRLSQEGEQDIAAYNYMLEVIAAVLNNNSPSTVYQNLLNDSASIVAQYVNTDYTAEPGVFENVTELVGIVVTALDDGTVNNLPERIVPNNTINIKTGVYRETLPIIVPAETALVGDEVRSVNAGPAGSLIDITDSYYTVNTFAHLSSVMSNIVNGTTVTPTTGNIESQSQDAPFADTDEVTAVAKLVDLMKLQSDYRLGTLHTSTLTDPVGYNTSYLIGYGDARHLLQENKKFLQEEVVAYMVANYPNLKYGKTKTRRDAGYIVDAVIYDLTYGGNALSVKAGLAYWDGDNNNFPQIPASIKAATLASVGFLKTRMQQVATAATFTPLQTTIPVYTNTAGSAGASTLIGNNVDVIIELITDGPDNAVYTLTDPTPANGVNSTTTLINEYNALEGGNDFDQVKDEVEAYLLANYSDVDYSVAKARRDAGIVLKAIGFDMMFNSNYQTIKAAHAYLRLTASELFDRDDRIKEATRNSLLAARDEALTILSDSTAEARLTALYDLVDTIIYSGSTEGDVCQTELRNRDYAALQLERNRQFIVEEAKAYIANTFKDTVTATLATTNVITISDTSWLRRNVAIKFSGTLFGGVNSSSTYYVQKILSATEFTIAITQYANDADRVVLSTDSGSMTVSMEYNQDFCLRDVGLYIDALKWDLKYTSNYKSTYVARYYANAVLGSLEEDMYYLRNGTGVRNQTLEGLSGDLTPENGNGTSRTTAGAYASLDPGWGPADFRTWIIKRSPYVQNVATFGYAAIGQKIDGALHNGGNDSIVSNDFTQLISDGIGAWVTNNGRAELVSVFTYYAHIGYLAENGGRIRGTNGNNSYGDFGSVAEGFDATETPIFAEVDNKAFVATVGSVLSDGIDKIWRFAYDNAGLDYTEATWTVSGGGSGVKVEQDDYRDGAVYQVRLLDNTDDSTSAPEIDGNFGGFGYVTNANTAQSGTTTSLTLAAVDDEITGAYVGMYLLITAGTGTGQYGIISSYTAGTKVADVLKETTGSPGWDHVVPGTAIVAPDASSTYIVEPRVAFSAPSYSSTARTLATAQTYIDAKYAETFAVYTPVSGTTSGSGANATFTVVRKGVKYQDVKLVSGGTGYARLDTITIAGTSLGGAATTNNVIITITAVGTNGVILDFEFAGIGAGGRFVAIASGSRTTNTSINGTTWVENLNSLPSTSNWVSLASGKLTTVESAGSFVTGRAYIITSLGNTVFTSIGAAANIVGTYFVATGAGSGSGTATPIASHVVAVSSSTTVNAYSTDGGVTWSAGGALPAGLSGVAVDVAYGTYNTNGRWIALGSNGSTAISINGGVSWTAGGSLPAGTWTSIAYGQGVWVAVSTGATTTAYSADGGTTWTAGGALPASSTWIGIAYGNNRFVAVSSDGTRSPAFSVNKGVTWSSTGVSGWLNQTVTGVRYGQGVFVATNSTSNNAVSSEDGIVWTTRALTRSSGTGFRAAIQGNPNRNGIWVGIPSASTTAASSALIGATAKGRAFVSENKIFAIRLIDSGSSYTSAPTITITDPNNLFEAPTQVRIGNGVCANPSFIDRGLGYDSAIAELDTGNGYADNFQSGQFMAVRRLTGIPKAGANVVFNTQPNTVYKLVNLLSQSGEFDGARGAFFQISPDMSVYNSPADGTAITTRIRYSQVRLTGHDFLDIGTGNFDETNYPGGVSDNSPTQANETVDLNGGRVFYTSTDQDGNFRVGELFTIEQSTGVATLNADAFNIAGLSELSLGNITLGGNSATITEFSTDPFLTANSDSVVPTQRAIKAYISAQIGGGGASLNVNSIVAGFIEIAGTRITTTTGGTIQMKANFNFQAGVRGYPIAWNYFLNN